MNKVTKGVSKEQKVAAQEAPMVDSLADMDDQLAIDPALKAELASKGYAYRWINGAKFKNNHGFDARRWQPYKRDSKTTVLENNFYGFVDSEGFIRRGDLLLAYRPQAVQDAVRAKNANKIRTLAGDQLKAAADSIGQSFKEAGMSGKAKVLTGFGED